MISDLLKKKRMDGPAMDDREKKSKLDILKQISDMAAASMGEEVKGLKKVEVAAPDRKGLEEGLDKAKQVVESRGDNEPGEVDPFDDNEEEEDKATEEPSHYSEHSKLPSMDDKSPEDEEHMSDEEINAQMERLHAMKLKNRMGK